MRRIIELRRHTDNDGDVLTDDGVQAALEIGRNLGSGYDVAVSTGAQRATQTVACFIAAGSAPVERGVVVNTGLRSDDEDRWKEAYQEAGSGELSAFRSVAPDFVEEECESLGAALREVLDLLDAGQAALVVGHSPTNEAAVYGLTGEEIASLGKGEGVRIIEDEGEFTVERLD